MDEERCVSLLSPFKASQSWQAEGHGITHSATSPRGRLTRDHTSNQGIRRKGGCQHRPEHCVVRIATSHKSEGRERGDKIGSGPRIMDDIMTATSMRLRSDPRHVLKLL
jgi:hypothetical protein